MGLESIGKNIRSCRIEKKLRQEDLAEKTFLSPNYIGAIERGEKLPALDTLIQILIALDISADRILADAIGKGYDAKDSLLSRKLEQLAPDERAEIYDVIDVMLEHARRRNA